MDTEEPNVVGLAQRLKISWPFNPGGKIFLGQMETEYAVSLLDINRIDISELIMAVMELYPAGTIRVGDHALQQALAL